jgi:hypothetical protein
MDGCWLEAFFFLHCYGVLLNKYSLFMNYEMQLELVFDENFGGYGNFTMHVFNPQYKTEMKSLIYSVPFLSH